MSHIKRINIDFLKSTTTSMEPILKRVFLKERNSIYLLHARLNSKHKACRFMRIKNTKMKNILGN